jgi:hypothetical protein
MGVSRYGFHEAELSQLERRGSRETAQTGTGARMAADMENP